MNYRSRTMLIFSYALLLVVVSFADEKIEDSFFVKPGAGDLSIEKELKEYKCKFSYKAMGGTHEEWAMSLELLDGGSAVMCSVERGIASYLFFDNFKMELTGPLVAITNVDVKSSQRENKNLKTNEYLLEANSISSVAEQFDHHLEKVAVYSPLSREEL